MFNKIKNVFNSRRQTATVNIEDILLYKNLIPNLVDEFSDENVLSKKRSNSFSKKHLLLNLSGKTLAHSNSGKLVKLKKKEQKKINVKASLTRHYFLGRTVEKSKQNTSKNVHRGSFNIKDIPKPKPRKSEAVNLNRIQTQRYGSYEEIQLKRSENRKKTIDPQDTAQAEHINFEISTSSLEIDNTKEKLEEYQEKMRKTQ